MIQGAGWFFKNVFLVLVIIELTLIVEEIFNTKLEFRKGFQGVKTSLIRVSGRHLLKFLRLQSSWHASFATSVKAAAFFVAVGLLPPWGGTIVLPAPHS